MVYLCITTNINIPDVILTHCQFALTGPAHVFMYFLNITPLDAIMQRLIWKKYLCTTSFM